MASALFLGRKIFDSTFNLFSDEFVFLIFYIRQNTLRTRSFLWNTIIFQTYVSCTPFHEFHYKYFLTCRSFCLFYDMQEHSTRIFHDMVNALTSFTQGIFTNLSMHSSSQNTAHLPSANTIQTPSSAPPPSVVALSAMGGVTPQPGFSYRGAWIPLSVLPVLGQAKPV